MTEQPFGTYALPAWGQRLAALCRRVPVTGPGRRLAFALRKPVLAAGYSPVDAEIGGARFRLHPRDNLSDKRLLCTPDLLDGVERRLLEERLPPESWVIDVGANIGGYCLLLAARRKDLRVGAVEADPETATRLAANIRFSGFGQRVRLLNTAVSGTAGTVTLARDAVNRGRTTVVAGAAGEGSVTVPALTLLDVLDRLGVERPGLVKLDIEGHEFPVLEGFFAGARPERWPQLLQLEQHRREPLNEAVALALRQGYRVEVRTRMNVILHRG